MNYMERIKNCSQVASFGNSDAASRQNVGEFDVNPKSPLTGFNWCEIIVSS